MSNVYLVFSLLSLGWSDNKLIVDVCRLEILNKMSNAFPHYGRWTSFYSYTGIHPGENCI